MNAAHTAAHQAVSAAATSRRVFLGALVALAAFGHTLAPAQEAQRQEAAPLTEGEIKRLDPAAGKLTIKHGPIANLDMPGMTMVFTARDSAALAALKVGDKIRFVASNEGGKYLASDIQAAP